MVSNGDDGHRGGACGVAAGIRLVGAQMLVVGALVVAVFVVNTSSQLPSRYWRLACQSCKLWSDLAKGAFIVVSDWGGRGRQS